MSIDKELKLMADLKYAMSKLHKPVRHELYWNRLLRMADTNLKLNKPSAKWLFREYIENCHPIVLMPESDTPQPTNLEVPIEPEPMDLPYPCCHFEVRDRYITVPHPSAGPIISEAKLWVCSIIAKEESPKVYSFLLHVEVDDSNGVPQPSMIEVRSDVSPENPVWYLYRFCSGIIREYCDKLAKDKVGVEMPRSTAKICLGGGTKNKKFLKPKPIVHVSPKRRISAVQPATLGADIDWSHRWEVRGHWREVAGIGKDRDGNYQVSGFTWVVNHVRGPEDKPVIKKTYIVHGGGKVG